MIQIITKKGRAGNVKWESRYETGQSEWDENLRPVNYAIATAARLADTVTWPGFKGKALSDIISFRPMSDGRALRTGGLTKYTALRERRRRSLQLLRLGGGKIRKTASTSTTSPTLNSLRGNFSFVPTNKLTFTTNVGLSHNHIRLPLNDNVAAGLIISSYLAVPGRTYAFPAGPEYSTITPELANIYDNQTWADRFFFGSTADYRPAAWLTNRVRVGLDVNVGTRAAVLRARSTRAVPGAFSLDLDNSKGFLAEGRPLTQRHRRSIMTGR